uniref:3'-5' exonuclease n=1 Tax=Glossina pallidipes TaxID=7398 RepID=A0A1A9ZXL8_GLOPL
MTESQLNKLEVSKNAEIQTQCSYKLIFDKAMETFKRRSDRLMNRCEKHNHIEKKISSFVKYEGKIVYLTNVCEIAEAADSLIQWVEGQHIPVPLSFDMEWPFSFKTGPGKTSVVQVCLELNCCYVFQLSNLRKLPAALVALLKHPRVRLHGVNIKNDFQKLARDFPEMKLDDLKQRCIDLGTWCNEINETGSRWSLDRLCNYLTNQTVDKNKRVRMSNWHVVPLNHDQLMYAAIDVYIGLVIYRELENRARIKKEKENEFVQNNGCAAFKAVKALGKNFLME